MNNCKPNCPICEGTGYVYYDVPVSHRMFGKAIPCRNLPPESPIFNNHGLSSAERSRLFWSGINDRENVGRAVQEVRESMKRGKGVGYLYGGAGLAKTLILKTACVEWVRSGNGYFHYVTLAEILEDLRMAYDDDHPSHALKEKEDWYARFSLLCIDEIGAQRLTEFGTEKFFSLVNRRHEAGTERSENVLTLMAGNASPKEIDFRITDRLTDGRNFVIRLTGESYRPALEWEETEIPSSSSSSPVDPSEVFDTGEKSSVFDTGERIHFLTSHLKGDNRA